MLTLVGYPEREPERDPADVYRGRYRGIMVSVATVLRKSGSLTRRR